MLNLILTILISADVARCESGPRFDDGAVVLQTAVNRARLWGRPLLDVLRQPRQFARGCAWSPRTWSLRHVRLGIDAALWRLDAPPWAFKAVEYLGPSDSPELTATRGPLLGCIVHCFHGPRRR